MNTQDYILDKFSVDGLGSPIVVDYPRDMLAKLFAELNFNIGVEIGVERGVFSEILVKANSNLKLFSIDPWKAYREYREHTTQEKIDKFYEEAMHRLAPYSAQIIREFSEEALDRFSNNSLDFVYIDGNHDQAHVLFDITQWAKKVRLGGIIAGHDYTRFGGRYGQYNQVKNTVDRYTADNNIEPWFVLKDPVERASWMWVKQ